MSDATQRPGYAVAVGLLDLLKRPWSLTPLARPWPATTSIYEHLCQHTEDGTLAAAGLELPGDQNEPGELTWAPGARDGILALHVGASGAHSDLAAMLAALTELLGTASAAHFGALYTLCVDGQIAGYVDELVDALNATVGLDAARVHALGKILALEAPTLEAVKLGITLMGMVETDDREILVQLGLHDELSMFAALALTKQLEDAEPVLFELAKRVHGWGRIHVVERLADTESAVIKAWLLREGFRNTVLDVYLAHLCASSGELHRALAHPDAALLQATAELFTALATGGPAPGLADYEHAAEALAAWLPHVVPDRAALVALDALAERPELAPSMRMQIDALRSNAAAQALRRPTTLH